MACLRGAMPRRDRGWTGTPVKPVARRQKAFCRPFTCQSSPLKPPAILINSHKGTPTPTPGKQTNVPARTPVARAKSPLLTSTQRRPPSQKTHQAFPEKQSVPTCQTTHSGVLLPLPGLQWEHDLILKQSEIKSTSNRGSPGVSRRPGLGTRSQGSPLLDRTRCRPAIWARLIRLRPFRPVVPKNRREKKQLPPPSHSGSQAQNVGSAR